VLTYTLSESAACESSETSAAAGQDASVLRARIERIVNRANDTSPHFVSRTGPLHRANDWRLRSFPCLFPYGIGDSVCRTRRTPLSEAEADVGQLLRK
jgi:hypothetical protein